MKMLLLTMLSGLLALSVSAQPPTLSVTTSKTVSLVFPSAVRHVDRGSRAVLVQPVPGAAHVLLVRAAEKDFAPTNLSVITADGVVYALGVVYEAEPVRWVYTLRHPGEVPPGSYARALAAYPRTLGGVSDAEGGVKGTLLGLYARGEVVYLHLRLRNSSALDFHTELVRFYLRDKKGGRKRPLQEREITPLATRGDLSVVPAGGAGYLVAALPRPAPGRSRLLILEVVEKDSGRTLQLTIAGRQLLRARSLPDLGSRE